MSMRSLGLFACWAIVGAAVGACDSAEGAGGTCPATACTGDLVCVAGSCVADPLATCPTGFVRVPAGTFQMGSPTAELGREADETAHAVTLTRAFCMQATEVTQAEFAAAVGYNPASDVACGTTCPVEDVRWMEAAAYCNALSQRDGLTACYTCTGSISDFTLSCTAIGDAYGCAGYRLPTEAEWEYAARAGTTTAFVGGEFTAAGFCEAPALDAHGWYCGNAGDRVHPVAGKQANAWGLYDMAGNVAEWCHDDVRTYTGDAATDPLGTPAGTRALRGGAYDQNPESCRSAARDAIEPGYAVQDQGFRVVRAVH